MVTKEECLLKKALDELEYDRNERLTRYIVNLYNQGKKYASEMVFPNDENGFYQALKGWGEAEICKVFYETVGDFDTSTPFFTVDYKLHNIDADDFVRMLTPEDKRKLMNPEIFEELSDSDVQDAFYSYLLENHPNSMNGFNFVEAFENYTKEQLLSADWDELINGVALRPVRLSESDIRKMTRKVINDVVKRGKR